VDAHQKYTTQQHWNLIPPEAREREEHHAHFKNFHAHADRPLAETVGKKAARHRK